MVAIPSFLVARNDQHLEAASQAIIDHFGPVEETGVRSQVRRLATQLPALMGTLLHCPDMSAGQNCIVLVKPVPSDLLSYALSQAGKMSERMGSSHKLLCNPQGR